MDVSRFVALACYQFTAIEDPAVLRGELEDFCRSRDIVGTLILAPEGINGTVAGRPEAIRALRQRFDGDARFAGMEAKESPSSVVPFRRLRVVCKPEIVTLRAADAAPLACRVHCESLQIAHTAGTTGDREAERRRAGRW